MGQKTHQPKYIKTVSLLVISAQVALAQLDLDVARTKSYSIKESTKKNILCTLTAYEKFCDRFNLPYFPCDNIQLCRFGQHLSQTFESPDAVGNYQSGVRTCLALLGLPIPEVKDRQIQMFTIGLRRVMQHEVKQAAPITPELLVKLSKVVDYKDLVELVSWTGTLLGFYMFLRKSNLVPDTMEDFNPEHQFTRDVNLTTPDHAMMFEIRWSKTIQFKQKVLRMPILPAQNKAICPVYWTYKMMQLVPAGPKDPVLAINYRNKLVSLSANQLIYRIRKWLLLIGYDPSIYSLHSLRRGGATFAYQSDLEGEMIKLLGGWASDAYKRYIDVSMDKRYESMKLFVEALNKCLAD